MATVWTVPLSGITSHPVAISGHTIRSGPSVDPDRSRAGVGGVTWNHSVTLPHGTVRCGCGGWPRGPCDCLGGSSSRRALDRIRPADDPDRIRPADERPRVRPRGRLLRETFSTVRPGLTRCHRRTRARTGRRTTSAVDRRQRRRCRGVRPPLGRADTSERLSISAGGSSPANSWTVAWGSSRMIGTSTAQYRATSIPVTTRGERPAQQVGGRRTSVRWRTVRRRSLVLLVLRDALDPAVLDVLAEATAVV